MKWLALAPIAVVAYQLLAPSVRVVWRYRRDLARALRILATR